MSVFAGPNVLIRDGLVLSYDVANSRSYDRYENLLTNSIRTANALGATSGSGWTITANSGVSPDGTLTATQLNQTSSLSNSGILWLSPPISSGRVLSVFCKAVSTGTVIIQGQSGNGDGYTANLSNNTFTDGSGGRHPGGKVEEGSSGWKRVSVPMVGNVGNDFYLTVQGTGTVLLWGWQLENGSVATDYYPTSGTAKNRGTTWTNLIGTGNNGTLTNGPRFNSTSNGVIVFDGANDYVICGTTSSLTFTNQISVCIWLSSNNTASTYQVPIAKTTSTAAPGATNGFGWWIFSYGIGGFWINNSPIVVGNPLALLNGQGIMSYLVGTYNGTTVGAYAGGLLGSTISFTTSTIANNVNAPIEIGRGSTTGYFNGNVAHVSIYNRALSAAEVQQNFNATRGRYGV